nr:hypothetical protein [Tanacetum cinerariifolium]
MSTQQDIYAAGSESHPPMLNKENYVPWSSRLHRYAKSRPNGKLIYNSILNGPYVRRMIPEPGDANREVTMTETFHAQTDDELSEKELKQIEADDQAIQTILLGLPKDIYAAVDKGQVRSTNGKGLLPMKGNRLSLTIIPKWSRHVTIVHQTKDLHTAAYTQLYDFLKYNQKEVDELKAKRLAKTQDPLALMANSNNPYAFPAPHQDQSSFNQNYLQQPMPNPKDITDPTTNQIGNGNLVAARAEGNAAGQNGNQIRCYNCRGQASTSGTQTNSAPVYDSDGSAEVHENCDDNEIFKMFTQEEQYTELLKPIPESHQVPHNDNDVISEDTSVEQGGETIEADDQAIQTILLGLSEDIYATIDSCETGQEIWLRVQQMMKGSDIGI